MSNIVDHKIYRNRPSLPIVYTISGTYVAACFTGQCTKHSTRYHTVDGKQLFHEVSPSTRNIQTTTHSVRGRANEAANNTGHVQCLHIREPNLSVQCTSRSDDQARLSRKLNFRCSNSLKHPGGQDWELKVTRLEDDWFVYQMVCTFTEDVSISRLFKMYRQQQKRY